MKITAKITKTFEDAGKLKAFATICLADAFLVTGVRIVECEKGLMVFMPSMKDKEMSTEMFVSQSRQKCEPRSITWC